MSGPAAPKKVKCLLKQTGLFRSGRAVLGPASGTQPGSDGRNAFSGAGAARKPAENQAFSDIDEASTVPG